MRMDIKVVRGTTNTFKISVTDAEGNPYILPDGGKLLFGVKKRVEDEAYIFVKSVTSGESGVYTVTLDPVDTDLCDCTDYLYDVGVQVGDDFYSVIPASTFTVCKNVTKWGCA